jgi:ATPase subunit of ABC transporter with duplicated ATPase domains
VTFLMRSPFAVGKRNCLSSPPATTMARSSCMLGQNGCGKTTFIKMLAGLLKPDDGSTIPLLNVSYKPQKIAPKFEGTVRQLLHAKIRSSYMHAQFVTDVMKPMNIDDIIDQEVKVKHTDTRTPPLDLTHDGTMERNPDMASTRQAQGTSCCLTRHVRVSSPSVLHVCWLTSPKNLSGGELQRVAIVLALGKPADIYLIDEPSAYLDSEQRIITAKVHHTPHTARTAYTAPPLALRHPGECPAEAASRALPLSAATVTDLVSAGLPQVGTTVS